jgi:hypothetical protein
MPRFSNRYVPASHFLTPLTPNFEISMTEARQQTVTYLASPCPPRSTKEWQEYMSTMTNEGKMQFSKPMQFWQGYSEVDKANHIKRGQCLNCIRWKRGHNYCKMDIGTESWGGKACSCCNASKWNCVWVKGHETFIVDYHNEE